MFVQQPLAYSYVCPNLARALALPANSIPVLLLLFTWELFEDEGSPPAAVWLLALLYLTLTVWILFEWTPGEGPTNPIAATTLQVAKFGFAVGSVLIVWKGRVHDLVETRLKLRRGFVVSIGLMVAIVTELTRLMTEDRLYTEHDLRIGKLAAEMNVAEHQLRRTINQVLGYRNFNQFINRYRIDEAARRLISEPRAPVLTIALDVGFRSISSFNAAFRAQHDCAPTVYRSKTDAG